MFLNNREPNPYKAGFIILLMITIASCTSEEETNSGGVVMHPVEENIPYFDNNHISIDKSQTSDSSFPVSGQVDLLTDYLNGEENITLNELNAAVSGGEEFQLKSVGKNRLVMLDIRDDGFSEYNLSTDTSISLAPQGRGPGDVALTKEMIKNDSSVYIAMQDGRIARFNCGHQPCEYAETIKVDQSPQSLAMAGDSLAVLSYPTGFGGNGSEADEQISNEFIQVFDTNHEIIGTFGKGYDIKGHWMLLRPLVGESFVRYYTEEELFILAFKRFPFLYIHDQNFDFIKSYEIKDFTLGKQKYRPDRGSLEIVMEDHSVIGDVDILSDNTVLVQTITKTIQDEDEGWQISSSYYLMDFSGSQSHYIGSKSNEEYENIHFTDQGLFLNKEGLLYQIQSN